MADRPILFSGPMVRALMEGRKTQTRRVFVPPPPFDFFDDISVELAAGVITPKYANGDRLWVRETFSYETLDVDRDGILPPWYWADGNPPSGGFTRPKPSIHMPRWASRLTLIVTDVRIQRLQEISEADAVAEGCPARDDEELSGMEARGWFRDLWDSLNAKRGYGWDANPWVAAINFDVRHCNIDRFPAPPKGGA